MCCDRFFQAGATATAWALSGTFALELDGPPHALATAAADEEATFDGYVHAAGGYAGGSLARDLAVAAGASPVDNEGAALAGYAAAPRPFSVCVAWRQHGQCDPIAGPREPWEDRGCGYAVPAGVSGACECAGGRFAHRVGCGPAARAPFNCSHACLFHPRTAPLPWDATAAAVKAALDVLPAAGTVAVARETLPTGRGGYAWTVTFADAANQPQALTPAVPPLALNASGVTAAREVTFLNTTEGSNCTWALAAELVADAVADADAAAAAAAALAAHNLVRARFNVSNGTNATWAPTPAPTIANETCDGYSTCGHFCNVGTEYQARGAPIAAADRLVPGNVLGGTFQLGFGSEAAHDEATACLASRCPAGPQVVGGPEEHHFYGFGYEESAPVPHDATAGEVEIALGSLVSVDAVSVRRTGPDRQGGYAWTVTFLGDNGPRPLLAPQTAGQLLGVGAAATATREAAATGPGFADCSGCDPGYYQARTNCLYCLCPPAQVRRRKCLGVRFSDDRQFVLRF